MTVVGISMVRDEADVVEGVLRHMAGEVDWLLVADNLSTDGTRDILDKLETELPLTVVDDPEPGYLQSEKMSRLADRAAFELGAEWIVPFDADELWLADDRVRTVLANSGSCPKVSARLFNHFATAIDPEGDDPFSTIVWRQREPAPLAKMAFRWEPGAVIEQGNHGVILPSGDHKPVELLEVRHFPYRSVEQFTRKARNGAAAYAATGLPYHVGQHWRQYGELLERHGEEALHEVYRTWFWHLSPSDAGLIRDPAAYMRWE